MEAIQHILNLEKAQTIGDADREMMAAHTAVNDAHLAKLREMEAELERRLGVNKAAGAGSSPMTDEDWLQRRPIRDDPQA